MSDLGPFYVFHFFEQSFAHVPNLVYIKNLMEYHNEKLKAQKQEY